MAETEKITINMSVVDLGKVDLLVQEGFYQNRTDFIRAAIRSQLDKHEPAVQSSIIRNEFGVGVFICSRSGLEEAQGPGGDPLSPGQKPPGLAVGSEEKLLQAVAGEHFQQPYIALQLGF